MGGDEKLSPKARTLIEDTGNALVVSVASLWEMAIKVSLGKLILSRPFGEFVQTQLSENDLDILGVDLTHLVLLEGMPYHHRDPFDRLIVAQCLAENLPLVSGDVAFDTYGVQRLW